MSDLDPALIEKAAEALDEWLFRMHGLTSSCRHHDEARAVVDAVADDLRREVREPWAGCTGAGDCPSEWHVHGCYADRGRCDDPTDHLDAEARADTLETQAGSLQRLCEELEARAERAETERDAILKALPHDWRKQYERATHAEAALSRVLADMEALSETWRRSQANAHACSVTTKRASRQQHWQEVAENFGYFADSLRARIDKHRQPAEDRPHGPHGGDVGTGATGGANGAQGGAEGFEGDA